MPDSLAMLVLTTSMPTPRPDSSVACSRVLKPGWKIRLTASGGVIDVASSGVTRPRRTPTSRIFTQSIPRPSSSTSITTRLPFWNARSSILPAGALPSALRSPGSSMP